MHIHLPGHQEMLHSLASSVGWAVGGPDSQTFMPCSSRAENVKFLYADTFLASGQWYDLGTVSCFLGGKSEGGRGGVEEKADVKWGEEKHVDI